MGKILKFVPRQPTAKPTQNAKPEKMSDVIDIASRIKGIFTQDEIDQIKKELDDEGETRA